MSNRLIIHPGYLGRTLYGGMSVIHADWPAYALGEGLHYALMSLGQFPPGTRFIKIDDIDLCYLFLVDDGRSRNPDKFAESNFHVALWHEDVSRLMNASFVAGVLPYAIWGKRRAAELGWLSWHHPDGTWWPFPPLEESEKEERHPYLKVGIDKDGFSLTQVGYQALELLLSNERAYIDDQIMQRARPALSAGLFDSAIREACVVLECEMRYMVGTAAYGARLIDDFFRIAMGTRRLIPSHLKNIKTEVRTAFRFVRNEYAHNLRTVEEVQCYAILLRLSNALVGIKEIAAVL